MTISVNSLTTIIQELQTRRQELLEYLTGDHDIVKTSKTRGQVSMIDELIKDYRRRINPAKET